MDSRHLVVLFFVYIIVIFLPQSSLSAMLTHQSTMQNIDTTEIDIKQDKDTNIFLDHTKIKEEANDMDAVKLEDALSIFGNRFIHELNNNGFSVNEYTTIKELLDMVDPNNFIINWAAHHPQEVNSLLNEINKGIAATDNKNVIPSYMQELDDSNKLIGAADILKKRLPRSVGANDCNSEIGALERALRYIIPVLSVVATLVIIALIVCFCPINIRAYNRPYRI